MTAVMEKIKVCHIAVAHKRYDKRILTKECVSLSKAGYDVTLLVADGKESEIYNGVRIKSVDLSKGSWWLGPGEWMIDGKKVNSKEVSLKNRVSRELYAHKYIFNDAVAVDAEIYHIHEPLLLRLGVKLKSIGKKVIFDSHENHPEQIKASRSIPSFLRKLCSLIYKIHETHVTRKLDTVIVPCTFFNGVNIFEGRCKKVEIISNAPKLEDFYDIYDQQQSVPKDSEPSVCYAGGLTHERGITHLIKAAYKAGVKLYLAGTFAPTGYKEQLENMPEYSCVDYKGNINYSDLVELYKQTNIGASILLSIGQNNTADNFTTKVYEYMSMGIPVILSRFIFVEEVLKKYRFGITVNPENVGEIATAIRSIIENPDDAKSMGEKGRWAIREMFNWSIEENKLIRLYDDILQNNHIKV